MFVPWAMSHRSATAEEPMLECGQRDEHAHDFVSQLRGPLPLSIDEEKERETADGEHDEQPDERSAAHAPAPLGPPAQCMMRRHPPENIQAEDGEHSMQEQERWLPRMGHPAELPPACKE